VDGATSMSSILETGTDLATSASVPTQRRRLLIVDDEPGVRESIRLLLRDSFDVLPAASGEEGIKIAAVERPDVVLLDIVMPGLDGLATLERLKGANPALPIVILTATKTVKTAVAAIKLGAFDYIQKPFDGDELRVVLGNAARTADLEREVEELRAEVGRRYQLGNIIGRSPNMQQIFKTVSLVAPMRTTVLITGESGTGKELIARALHYQSPRAGRPMVAINCAAIPETLLESQLFGHEKGSFTGADMRKIGQFEAAHQSTIFLDEIGELLPSIQAKLLRVIETGEVTRVGSTRPIAVDVRIVAATNRKLEEAILDGSFRSDLFYRLNVVSLALPPLRARREDLPLLIRYFSQAKAADLRVLERPFAPDTIDLMLRYRWPGNVRELENLIERLLILSRFGPIQIDELPEVMRRETGTEERADSRTEVFRGTRSLAEAVEQFERGIIQEALQRFDFNQTRTAEMLGTTRRILKYRMDKLGIGER
jgi:DNA-binding NtrC family response regulator